MSSLEIRDTSSPNREISPRVGLTESRISRSRVVLPAPEGPVRNWNEFGLDGEGQVAQNLRAHAVAHAHVLEVHGRAAPSSNSPS
jgi:hypothetical protein